MHTVPDVLLIKELIFHMMMDMPSLLTDISRPVEQQKQLRTARLSIRLSHYTPIMYLLCYTSFRHYCPLLLLLLGSPKHCEGLNVVGPGEEDEPLGVNGFPDARGYQRVVVPHHALEAARKVDHGLDPMGMYSLMTGKFRQIIQHRSVGVKKPASSGIRDADQCCARSPKEEHASMSTTLLAWSKILDLQPPFRRLHYWRVENPLPKATFVPITGAARHHMHGRISKQLV